MKKIHQILKSRKGSSSIFVIMILVFLFPFAIWVGIELPKTHEANQRVKDAVDSAASSAVTIVDNSRFDDGYVKYNDTEIYNLASRMVAEKIGAELVDGVWQPKEGSAIKKDSVEIKVRAYDHEEVNESTPISVNAVIPNSNGSYWTKTIKKPTVIVETKVTYKKIGLWGDDVTIYQTGMSQVNMEW